MALRIWGHDKQMSLSEYSYKWAGLKDKPSNRWGMTCKEMYDHNIKDTFDYCWYNYQECAVVGTPDLEISFIDDTDFDSYSIMLVSGVAFSGHYIMIIGVSEDKSYYLVTDQSKKIWMISYSAMKNNNMFYYRSNAGYSALDVRSYYRVG